MNKSSINGSKSMKNIYKIIKKIKLEIIKVKIVGRQFLFKVENIFLFENIIFSKIEVEKKCI